MSTVNKNKGTNACVFAFKCTSKDLENKVFVLEHHLQPRSGLYIPLFPPPPPSLAFIYFFALFSHSIRFSLCLSISHHRPCSLSSFFSPLPLYVAVTDFFFPRQKYEYFRAKKLKGNNETAPKLNYTPFPEPQKSDFPE